MRHRDSLLHHLRRVALHALGEPRTDAQLLEHFIAHRDETAFEALLRRHGPMVRGVCQRILGDAHDADDAFQATFLVLVRKAASVRPREAVGNFLYGVAYRTALEARRRIARRRTREMPLPNVPQPEGESSGRWQELLPLLDREISRLSEKYRLPIVLCELEGRSRKEVARQLAIPEGTLSSRLATARKKLAARLARYGLAFSGASLAALLPENPASACVPAALSGATLKAAMLMATGPAALGVVSTTVTTLTEGVLKAMFIAKIKTATVILCGVAVLGLGTGGVIYQTRAGAADPQEQERSVQRQSRQTIEADPEKDKLRQIAEEAQASERALRESMKKLSQEVARLRTQAEAQQNPEETFKKYEIKRVRLILEHQVRSNQLEYELEMMRRSMEAQLRDQLVELEGKLSAVSPRKGKVDQPEANQPNPRMDQKPTSGDKRDQNLGREERKDTLQLFRDGKGRDKLDQILERLERLEKRLDRLEGRKPEPSKP